jgi:predicted naringenin-chalcone synthase
MMEGLERREVFDAEADVFGNNVAIADNSSAPNAGDWTLFQSTFVASTSTRTYEIRNTGTSELTVGTVTSADSQFVVTSAPASPIAAGSTASFVISFTPTSAAAATSTISFSNNDADENPYNFDVSGTGEALATPTVTINNPLSGNTKVYDRVAYTATAGVTGGNASTPAATFTYFVGANTSGTSLGAIPPINVGTYTVVASVAATSGSNAASSSPYTYTITPRLVSTTINTPISKVYNATTVATVTLGALTNVISPDVVSALSWTASYNNKSVGTGKTVTLNSLTLTGAQASNYTFTTTPVTSNAGVITAATLSYSTVTAATRQYDGTVNVAVNFTPTGIISPDTATTVTLTAVGTVVDKNVGNNKPVTVGLPIIGGADGGNYVLTGSPPPFFGLTANITQRQVVATPNNPTKVYDGTRDTTVTFTVPTGVAGESLIVNPVAGLFDDKNQGTSKPVTFTIGALVAGNGATLTSNYVISPVPTSTTGTITRRALTATPNTPTKVYDQNTSITVGFSLATVVPADVSFVTASAAGTFNDKNVGTGKSITFGTIALAGTESGNYQIAASPPTTTTGTITALALPVTGLTGNNKVYDASIVASVTGTAIVTPISGDTVSVVGSPVFAFNNKNVGVAKPITATGYTLTDTDALNYSIVQPTGLTGDITAAPITITGVVANNKTYDGNTTATVTGTPVVTPLGSDDVSVIGTPVFNFNNKNVGIAKPITVTGYTLDGADASNYSVNQPAGLTADIDAKLLTASGTAPNKVYDGLTSSAVTITLVGVLPGEDVDGTASGTFADPNVSNGKTVTINIVTLSGQDFANYTVGSAGTTSADITPAALTISGVNADPKTYDGNTVAILSGTPSYVGLVNGETFSVTGTGVGTFASANVGPAVAVSVTGYTAPTANYTVSQPTGLSAAINAAALTISGVSANSKTYDGNTVAILSGTPSYVGLVNGETFSVTGTGVGTFASANVGPAVAVSVTGYTAPTANYTVSQPTGLSAAINAAALTISGVSANSKTYDGNTVAILSGTPSYVGLVNGETFSVTGTGVGTFASANVGPAVAVSVTGYTAPTANYTVSQPTGLSAAINAAALTISGVSANSKTYDGNTVAILSGTPSYVGLVNGETFSVTGTGVGTFASANVGPAVAVSVTGYTAPTANYTVSQPTGLSAAINAAALTISGVSANSKTYDGNTVAILSGTPSYVGLVNGETFSVTGTGVGTFASANVGPAVAVSVTGYTAPTANYTVSQPTGLSAAINAKDLVGSITASNKIFNGNNTATIVTRSLTGVIGGDDVSYVGGTAAFATSAIGNGITVTATGLSLSGAGAGNYSVNTTATTTADIIKEGTIQTRGLRYLANNPLLLGTSATNSLATDKVALRTGASSFANYTNYSRGLTGVVVDIADLPASTTPAQLASSLQFAQWNGIAAGGFGALSGAAVPTVTIVSGAGASGSARVQIQFPDNTVQNTWLRVTVVAGLTTALTANDVFYFGNVIGDFNVGNIATRLRVNATDTGAVRSNQSTAANSAPVTNIFDVNRDGRVNATDTGLVRSNQQTAGIVAPITIPGPIGPAGFGPSGTLPGGLAAPVVPTKGTTNESLFATEPAPFSEGLTKKSDLGPVLVANTTNGAYNRDVESNVQVGIGSGSELSTEDRLANLDNYFASIWKNL